MIAPRERGGVSLLAVAVVLVVIVTARDSPSQVNSFIERGVPRSAREQPPGVVIAAGDIATCDQGAESTARLVEQMPGTVLALGDTVYQNGTALEYAQCYTPTWGKLLTRTRAVPGNHEYQTMGALPYYQYFGDAGGPEGRGYYSFDIGTWHLVALNSNCAEIGGCGAGSAQWHWLREDLAQNKTRCALAYWHHPRFSSSRPTAAMHDAWRLLHQAGVDLVLNAHDHHYERFAPQDANGKRDDERGIRQFIVGTGGAVLRPIREPAPHSEVRIVNRYGVIRLELHRDRYAWSFIQPGGEVLDEGSTGCH